MEDAQTNVEFAETIKTTKQVMEDLTKLIDKDELMENLEDMKEMSEEQIYAHLYQLQAIGMDPRCHHGHA